MNCECVMVCKTDRTDIAKLRELASLLNRYVAENVELYPVCISEITDQTNAYRSYDAANGWGPKGTKTTLNSGDLVLFIAGKLHYMNKSSVRNYLPASDRAILTDFDFWHPAADDDFFEDLEDCDDDQD